MNSPTDEQSAIDSFVFSSSDNLMISALAGTGKTTTLEMIDAKLDGPALYCAFNKKIAKEAESRVRSLTQVRTFNGLGHRIWAAATGKTLKVNPKKCQDILKEILDGHPQRNILSEDWFNILQAVQVAKNQGYIPTSHTLSRKSLLSHEEFGDIVLGGDLDEVMEPTSFRVVDEILLRSIKSAYQGQIDFDDQIYMPTLFGGAFPKFPLVFVDEYQDLNPLNHHMIKKLVHKRLIGVGDDLQSIYAFRGAQRGGMASAISTHSMAELPLSISFRCPSRIVQSVQWHAPNFRWFREGGELRAILGNYPISEVPAASTIICRNNAPLMRTAMQFLRAKRSVNVAGSDISTRLISILKKLDRDDNLPQEKVLAKIDEWQAARIAKGSKSAEDTAECLRVFAREGTNLSQAVAYAQHLFAQEGDIYFTTGHRSKGLEWDHTYILDEFLIGKTPQEKNLKYVMHTRSKDKCYKIDGEMFV